MSIRIAVCIKLVPDAEEIRIDKENKEFETEKIRKIINREDVNALEESLKVKDICADTHITVVTMGPPKAKDALLECLALGADDAVLITDNRIEKADTLVTTGVLSAAINKIGGFDLIFTGNQATGGDTGQVGPQLAEKLRIPQVTGVLNFELKHDTKSVIVKKAIDNKYMTISVKMPCLLTAARELNKPRTMSLGGILTANKKEIKEWNIDDLGLSINDVGLNASPTKEIRRFIPFHNKNCKLIKDTEEEAIQKLLNEIQSKFII